MSPTHARKATAFAMFALLSACGGSGSDPAASPAPAPAPAPAPVQKSLTLQGTSAIGAALANASVTVKCASGTDTTTTNASGAYSLTIADGVLPCVIQVSGDAGGTTVTLHSITEQGTASADGSTTAVANVTPLTEMIVAQLTGAMPADAFQSFGSTTTISADELKAATSAVITALKTATGIDLTAIDPFKDTLVAASSTTSTGNQYDQLLDQLGAKVSIEALPLVVNQIASTAAAPASGTDAPTLTTVMQSVNGGSMPGCSHVMSGRYRFVEFSTGRVFVSDVDFAKMAFLRPDGTTGQVIAPLDSAKPCEFTASGKNASGSDVTFSVQMGQGGAGAYRIVNTTTSGSSTGYIFPVQAHPVSALQGEWTLLSSGNYQTQWEHVLSKITFAADGKAMVCDYDTIDNPVCLPVADAVAATSRADGGFDMLESDGSGFQTWLYRAPDGSVIAYGSANPSGLSTAEDRSTLVATRPRKLPLPAVGSVARYTEFVTLVNAQGYQTSRAADAVTYTSVDAATSTATRRLTSNGRVDALRFNHPIDGTRFRAAGTDASTSLSFSDSLQLPLGSGMAVVLGTNPDAPYVHGIVVNRP